MPEPLYLLLGGCFREIHASASPHQERPQVGVLQQAVHPVKLRAYVLAVPGLEFASCCNKHQQTSHLCFNLRNGTWKGYAYFLHECLVHSCLHQLGVSGANARKSGDQWPLIVGNSQIGPNYRPIARITSQFTHLQARITG